MGFSATGNLLPGSIVRPDTVTFIFSEQKRGSSSFSSGSTSCRLNRVGYIPLVSTITGLGRALLGVVHTIVHLASSIFSKDRKHHLEEASLGAINIGRGLVEAIPVVGNIAMLVVDLVRMSKFEKMAKQQIDKNEAAYNNHATMFIYGQERAKRPIEEFNAEIKKLNRKPSITDIEKIIRNQVPLKVIVWD